MDKGGYPSSHVDQHHLPHSYYQSIPLTLTNATIQTSPKLIKIVFFKLFSSLFDRSRPVVPGLAEGVRAMERRVHGGMEPGLRRLQVRSWLSHSRTIMTFHAFLEIDNSCDFGNSSLSICATINLISMRNICLVSDKVHVKYWGYFDTSYGKGTKSRKCIPEQ